MMRRILHKINKLNFSSNSFKLSSQSSNEFTNNIIPKSMLKHLPQHDPHLTAYPNLEDLLSTDDRRLVVIDDNGNGASTVHDIEILYDYTIEALEKQLIQDNETFFIVANTR